MDWWGEMLGVAGSHGKVSVLCTPKVRVCLDYALMACCD